MRLRICTLLALLLAAATAAAAVPAPPPLAPLARSALVTLEGASLPDALLLRVRSSAGGAAPLVSDFTVSLDGKPAAATALPDGSWRVALPTDGQRPGRIEATITHDGISEVLAGSVAAAAPGAAPAARGTGAFGVHKQIVWWILNVLIVLVAAIAISRRTS